MCHSWIKVHIYKEENKKILGMKIDFIFYFTYNCRVLAKLAWLDTCDNTENKKNKPKQRKRKKIVDENWFYFYFYICLQSFRRILKFDIEEESILITGVPINLRPKLLNIGLPRIED